MRIFHRCFGLCLILFLPCIALATTVHEYNLQNGLKLIVKEDHRAPVAVSQIWYRVGGSYEALGQTGISHLLEHLMFQGTPKHPNYVGEIQALGGKIHAETDSDYTFYSVLLPKQHIAQALALEADRMQNLNITSEALAKQLQVVKLERRLQIDADPRAVTYERFNATAFLATPYRNPVIGWPRDINRLSLAAVKNWYHTWYAPNHATLIVVGDVNPAHIYQLAQRYFATIPPQPVVEPQTLHDSADLGTRVLNVELAAPTAWLLMGYNAPSLLTSQQAWEPYALQVLAAVLSGSQSSRFANELVDGTHIASNAQASYDPATRLDSIFNLLATPSQGHSLTQLHVALQQEIDWLSSELLSADELQRAKNYIISQQIYSKDAIDAQAQRLGRISSIGLPVDTLTAYNKQIARVSAEQIRQVARKYLTKQRLTVANLHPVKITKT